MAADWGAILGAAGSIFGANKSAKAAENAAKTQAETARWIQQQQERVGKEGYNNALNFYNQQQNSLGELYSPYKQAGEKALGRLQQEAFGGQLSPLYKLQQEELTKSLNEQMAQRGMYGSGRALEMQGSQQRSLGASEAMRQQQLMEMLYSSGMQATQGLGNATMQTGSNMANLASNLGSNLGNSYGSMGNSLLDIQNQQGQSQANYWGDIGSALGTLGSYYSSRPKTPTTQKPTNVGPALQQTQQQYGFSSQNPFGALGNMYGRAY